MRFRLRIALLCFLSGIMLSSLLGVKFNQTDLNEIVIQELEITQPNRGVISFSIFYSSSSSDTLDILPIVLTLHGISGSSYGLYAMNMEIARHNFIVVSIDLPGHGSSPLVFNLTDIEKMRDDCISVLQNLETEYGLNVSNYGVVGHSLGGVVGYYLASSVLPPRCVVSIGSTGGSNIGVAPDSPENLLIAIGSGDEVVTETDALQALRIYTGNTSAVVGTTYGSFLEGNASRLLITNSNHISEVSDPTIIREAIDWLSLSLDDNGSINDDVSLEVGFLFLVGTVALYASTFLFFITLHSSLKQSKHLRNHSFQKKFYLREVNALSYLSLVGLFPIFIIGIVGDISEAISYHDISIYGILTFSLTYTLLLHISSKSGNNQSDEPIDLVWKKNFVKTILVLICTIAWFVLWIEVGGVIATRQWIMFPTLRRWTLPRYLFGAILILVSFPFLLREAQIYTTHHLNLGKWNGWRNFLLQLFRIVFKRLALLGLLLGIMSFVMGQLNLSIPTGIMIAVVVVMAFLVTVQGITTLTLVAGIQLTREIIPSVLLSSWFFAFFLVSALPLL